MMLQPFLQTGFLLLVSMLILSSAEKSETGFTRLANVQINCTSSAIKVTVSSTDSFNGMIYPRGLSKNSTCLMEYDNAGSKVTYTLPLRSCNTMSHDTSEGVEYYNTVIIQPHNRLVTNHGKGFHVKCKYESKETAIHSDLTVKDIGTTQKAAAAVLPDIIMRIYNGRVEEHKVAEHVQIGDYLTIVIKIDEQKIYGLKIVNCIVKDGLEWSEQPLINNEGCPIDDEIMGAFEYNEDLTSAQVTFPAHKFPFTSSVYYQCTVKLCLKFFGACEDVPPVCDKTGRNVHIRRRRDADVENLGDLEKLRLLDEDVRDRSVEVYSGLYVNELDNSEEETYAPSNLSKRSEDEFCVSTRKFAIGIAIAGVLLMLAVLLLVICIVHRRRRRKGSSTAGSSIYSGPYSNHAYSRD